MPNYTVNKNTQSDSRDHEVHDLDSGCSYLPSVLNRIDLGRHSSCSGAVQAAKTYYDDVNGCFYCARDCHTS